MASGLVRKTTTQSKPIPATAANALTRRLAALWAGPHTANAITRPLAALWAGTHTVNAITRRLAALWAGPHTAKVLTTTAFLLCCCTTTEPAVAPLGFGPLAKAEIAERERRAQQAPPPMTKRGEQQARAPVPSVSAAPQTPVKAEPSTPVEPPPSRSSATADASVDAVPKASDWVGLWRGKDTTRFRIPTFPTEPMTDDRARIRVELVSTQEIRFVLIDSSNDQDLCSLPAKLVSSKEATITSDQPCFGTEDESFELAVHVRSGAAKLQNETLSLDMVLDAQVTSDQLQSTGTVEYHFEGTH